MKNLIYIICLFLLISLESIGQQIDTAYFPPYNGKVSKEVYSHGKNLLINAYSQITNDKGKLVYADYWNVAAGYARMGVKAEIIFGLLKKSKEMEPKSFCQVVKSFSENEKTKKFSHFKNVLKDSFGQLVSDCSNTILTPYSINSGFNKKENLELKKFNEELIDRLIYLKEKDQRYRYSSKIYHVNLDRQRKLDNEVREGLIEIFDKYGYPGVDLVSEKFSDFGCLLLEHAGDIPTYDKYFDLVARAYKNGDVKRNYFTMLIDRIHWRKTGRQIFGSHAGVPFAAIEIIDNIKWKYDL